MKEESVGDSKKTSNKQVFNEASQTRLRVCVIIVVLVVICLLSVGCMIWMGYKMQHPEVEVIEHHDTMTLWKHDTVKIPKDSIIYRTKIVKVLDTIRVQDTTLSRVQKLYDDSIARIWYSGVDSEIDSINYTLKEKETIITHEKEIHIKDTRKTAWSVTIGPYVGGGIAIKDNQLYISPEVGVGVTIGWSILLNKKEQK